MTPRGLLTTIGATALGFGLVIGGTSPIPDVFAQAATPPAAEAPAQSAQGQRIDFEAQRAQAYDSFVAALASELGTDKTAVDAAIRKALTQQVDERAAAGDIGVEQAAAMKAVIQVSQAPLFLGLGGHGGMRGFDDHEGLHGPGGRADDEDSNQDQPSDDESAAGLPGDNSASNQSAPAPMMPADSVVVS
jgi:hypothetical protein